MAVCNLYDKLRETLEKNGYVVDEMDLCVFNRTVNGKQTTLLVHVDNILCLAVALSEHKTLTKIL